MIKITDCRNLLPFFLDHKFLTKILRAIDVVCRRAKANGYLHFVWVVWKIVSDHFSSLIGEPAVRNNKMCMATMSFFLK